MNAAPKPVAVPLASHQPQDRNPAPNSNRKSNQPNHHV